jgi:hypothetical protein
MTVPALAAGGRQEELHVASQVMPTQGLSAKEARGDLNSAKFCFQPLNTSKRLCQRCPEDQRWPREVSLGS